MTNASKYIRAIDDAICLAQEDMARNKAGAQARGEGDENAGSEEAFQEYNNDLCVIKVLRELRKTLLNDNQDKQN